MLTSNWWCKLFEMFLNSVCTLVDCKQSTSSLSFPWKSVGQGRMQNKKACKCDCECDVRALHSVVAGDDWKESLSFRLSSNVRTTSGNTVLITVTLPGFVCIFLTVFEEKRDCSQSNTLVVKNQLWYQPKSEQGWRSGESTHLPPMCPRFDSLTRRHMWV